MHAICLSHHTLQSGNQPMITAVDNEVVAANYQLHDVVMRRLLDRLKDDIISRFFV